MHRLLAASDFADEALPEESDGPGRADIIPGLINEVPALYLFSYDNNGYNNAFVNNRRIRSLVALT